MIHLRRVIDGHEHQRLVDVVVPAALKRANAADYANDRRIVADLAVSVARELTRFAARTELLRSDWTNAALDEAFASYVEAQLGKKGAQWAQILRRDAQTRTGPDQWRLWRPVDTGETFLIGMTKILWERDVLPAVRHLERVPPALTAPVYDDLVRIHSRAYQVKSSIDAEGAVMTLRLVDEERRDEIDLVPTVTEDTIRFVHEGAGLLKSFPAQRVLRWEITQGNERVVRGVPDARTLVIHGGWSVFAAQLGFTNKQAASDLRAILHAQAAVRIRQADGSRGNMLALREVPQLGRSRGRIEIVLGTMLLPYYVYEFSQAGSGRAAREAKRLVPLPQFPPFVGRPNEHGPQATASMLLVRELRAHAVDLFRNGAVHIPPERMRDLFGEACVPDSLVPRLVQRWTRDGEDGPAFLNMPDADTYTLGDSHRRARDFMLEAGKKEALGSHAGRASVRNRLAKLGRLAS